MPLFRHTNVWSENEGWQLLFYYNLYHLGLALVLITLVVPTTRTLTEENTFFLIVLPIVGIVTTSAMSLYSIRRRRPALHVQAHGLFVLHILFIGVLSINDLLQDFNTMVFYMTAVAVSAILFKASVAALYAAACLTLILYHDYIRLAYPGALAERWTFVLGTAVGMLSIVLAVGYIARNAKQVRIVVQQQESDLADLDQLTGLIIDQLELGLMFLDHRLNIKLINERAKNFIGDFIDANRVQGRLAELIADGQNRPTNEYTTLRHHNRSFRLYCIPLRNGLLINLEDQTRINRQIQHNKLASMGRMVSAVAHEIRNPLDAIDHAAQLLQPIDRNHAEETALINIIRKHARRIDRIIESVAEHNRPGTAQPAPIALTPWLHAFIDTFNQTISTDRPVFRQAGAAVTVLFNPTQLEQVLTNLCQNSLKYADTTGQALQIHLQTGTSQTGGAYLEVADNGQPIAHEQVEHMFEPLYTSDSRSTGLGLFLAREWCAGNHADIDYFSDRNRHGFRIVFQTAENPPQPAPAPPPGARRA